MYGEWGSDFIIFMGVFTESRTGLGVGRRWGALNGCIVHGFGEQWLFMVFSFSLFLVPLAGSSHCSSALVDAGDSAEYEKKKTTFCSFLIFLKLLEILGHTSVWRLVFPPGILEFSPLRCSLSIFYFVPKRIRHWKYSS